MVASLRGAAEAATRLKQTCLRDFDPPIPADESREMEFYRLPVERQEAPVPFLMKYALSLVGLASHGPQEKVAWWVDFTFGDKSCQLAYEKFGLRLYVGIEETGEEQKDEEAVRIRDRVVKKLQSATRIVEPLILDAAPDLLSGGDAMVVNQHASLRRAYEYFRERAVNPQTIEDERTVREYSDGVARAVSFKSGAMQMQLHAFHDMVAAITAFLSLLEHDLVLALAFRDFDPANDDLTAVIGSRWGDKFVRVLGKEREAARYRQRLTDVVERWRNPYSHGGFEKGHGATIYLHVPGVGSPVPVGLSGIRKSPLFSFLPADETDIADVFSLFDALESWLNSELSEAMSWIDEGLDVRFDEDFRDMIAEARRHDDFEGFLRYSSCRRDMHDNMDY